MICSYCESKIRVVPADLRCPNCGAPLEGAVHQKLQFPEPPLGKYKQPFKCMEVQSEGVCFSVNLLGRKSDRTIAYEQIAAVKFVPATKNELGFLSVRAWQDRDIPLPRTHNEASLDNTSVIFGDFFNERYGRIYEFLKQCEQIANEAREE